MFRPNSTELDKPKPPVAEAQTFAQVVDSERGDLARPWIQEAAKVSPDIMPSVTGRLSFRASVGRFALRTTPEQQLTGLLLADQELNALGLPEVPNELETSGYVAGTDIYPQSDASASIRSEPLWNI